MPLSILHSSQLTAPSLANLLSRSSTKCDPTDIDNAIQNTISNQSYANYPYQPTNAITKNFVSSDNNTMLIILGFSSEPDVKTVAQVKSDIQNSESKTSEQPMLPDHLFSRHDIENAFTPALEVTIGPGIAISLLIVGILFLAPLAAIIPHYNRRRINRHLPWPQSILEW